MVVRFKVKEKAINDLYNYKKHFAKMLRNVGMDVPKTVATRCGDGSIMQARHSLARQTLGKTSVWSNSHSSLVPTGPGIGKTCYRKTAQVTPSLHFFKPA